MKAPGRFWAVSRALLVRFGAFSGVSWTVVERFGEFVGQYWSVVEPKAQEGQKKTSKKEREING